MGRAARGKAAAAAAPAATQSAVAAAPAPALSERGIPLEVEGAPPHVAYAGVLLQ